MDVRWTAVVVSVVFVSLGCTGTIFDAAGSERLGDGPDGRRSGPGPSVAECADGPDVGPSPLLRLTRDEYNNTVADLLGDDTHPADAFPVDEELHVFVRNAGLSVTTLSLDQYRAAAERLAVEAVSDLDALLPCDPTVDGEDECVRTFISRFGRRAFRRPLEAREATALYDLGLAYAGDVPTVRNRVEGILTGMLQSPQFLYRIEPSVEDGAGSAPVSDYELASRLSFFLWGSAPSEALLDAAEAGELTAEGGLAVWAEQMIDDPRFSRGLSSFASQWLRLSDVATMPARDGSIYPTFDDALRGAMRTETLTFFEEVVARGDGALSTLLTADYTYANAELADLYGATYPEGAEGFVRVDLPPEERAGILTQASLMSLGAHPDQSSPVRRGVYVRERFLCDPPPPPPPDVNDTPPPPVPGQTTRERFAAHTEDPVCASCHATIDPIGWGFEGYDAIGQFRTEDLGVPVDSTGRFEGTWDADGDFDGAVELAARLAPSAQVEECVVDLMFEFGVGRVPGGCETASARERFQSSGGNLRELIVGIVTSDAFRLGAPNERGAP